LENLDERPDGRSEHHSQNQNYHDVLDTAADGHDQQQDERRPDPCGARRTDAGQQRMPCDAQQRRPQQKQRHAETRARADTQHERARQRIAEQRLHQQAAGRKRKPRQHGDDGLYQPDFQNDVARHGIARPARQQGPHLAAAHADRSRCEIEGEEHDDDARKEAEKNSSADFEGGFHFLRKLFGQK